MAEFRRVTFALRSPDLNPAEIVASVTSLPPMASEQLVTDGRTIGS